MSSTHQGPETKSLHDRLDQNMRQQGVEPTYNTSSRDTSVAVTLLTAQTVILLLLTIPLISGYRLPMGAFITIIACGVVTSIVWGWRFFPKKNRPVREIVYSETPLPDAVLQSIAEDHDLPLEFKRLLAKNLRRDPGKFATSRTLHRVASYYMERQEAAARESARGFQALQDLI